MPKVVNSNCSIKLFRGQYSFLSNFYRHPFTYKGLEWVSAEHAYQAQKMIHPKDFLEIANAVSPQEARKRAKGKKVKRNWYDRKYEVMQSVIKAKFSDPELKARLLETKGKQLIMCNRWNDLYWGVDEFGNGLNKLGWILMEIRDSM